MFRSIVPVLVAFLLVTLQFPTKSEAQGKINTQILFKTNAGEFVIELADSEAPVTAKNFIKYVESGFFDSTIFHRIIPGFVIQGGGFTGKQGSNLKKQVVAGLDTSPIVNEANNGLKNVHYSLSMARTNDPNSATSQFFINLQDNDSLDYHGVAQPGYAVFGNVIKGQEVIDKLGTVKTGTVGSYADVPVEDVIVISAKILEENKK